MAKPRTEAAGQGVPRQALSNARRATTTPRHSSTSTRRSRRCTAASCTSLPRPSVASWCIFAQTTSLKHWASLAAIETRQVTASTSWLEAPPLPISARLRVTGRYQRPALKTRCWTAAARDYCWQSRSKAPAGLPYAMLDWHLFTRTGSGELPDRALHPIARAIAAR